MAATTAAAARHTAEVDNIGALPRSCGRLLRMCLHLSAASPHSVLPPPQLGLSWRAVHAETLRAKLQQLC